MTVTNTIGTYHLNWQRFSTIIPLLCCFQEQYFQHSFSSLYACRRSSQEAISHLFYPSNHLPVFSIIYIVTTVTSYNVDKHNHNTIRFRCKRYCYHFLASSEHGEFSSHEKFPLYTIFQIYIYFVSKMQYNAALQ